MKTTKFYAVRLRTSDCDGNIMYEDHAFCATRQLAEREKALLEAEYEPAYSTDEFFITEAVMITG